MSRRLLPFLVALFVTSAAWLGSLLAEDAADAERRLADRAKILASDEYGGRGLGTEGLNKAADYLAREFASFGLKTDLYDGAPFQKFTVNTHTELGPKEQNRLKLAGPPIEGGQEPRVWDLALSQDFNPLAVGGSAEFNAPLVFAGYGITARFSPEQTFDKKELVYDDYAGIDVKGKVVIVIRKEPQQKNPHSPFDGTQASQHAPFTRKIANASEHGAAAVIFVNDGAEISSRTTHEKTALKNLIEMLTKAQTAFQEQQNPTPEVESKYRAEVAKLAEQIQQTAKRLDGGLDQVLGFEGAGPSGNQRRMPVLFCSRAKIDLVSKTALGKDLAALEGEIDSDLVPRSAELTNWKAEGQTSVVRKEAEIKNVVAVLEGEGPLADETVVVGAHYDHLGLGGSGSLAPWTKEIHNGADDNASGTVTLLEIAQRLAAREKKPARRVVFIAFTGEERGLWGSEHYVKQPRFPLDKTVAMVNLDMVGRLNNNKLILYGTGTAKEFEALIDDLNNTHKFDISRKPGGFGPSDHSSFYAKKIPVFHFFTGTHTDYHRPSDDADKLNVAGMRRIADMTTDLVTRLVDAPQRPTYVENRRQERVDSNTGAGDRPYFGAIPDYTDEGNGLPITGVGPESPAQKAGLKASDIIVQLGASKITGIEDFDSALRKHKAGESVKVKVKRGAEIVELEVVLGRPR